MRVAFFFSFKVPVRFLFTSSISLVKRSIFTFLSRAFALTHCSISIVVKLFFFFFPDNSNTCRCLSRLCFLMQVETSLVLHRLTNSLSHLGHFEGFVRRLSAFRNPVENVDILV